MDQQLGSSQAQNQSQTGQTQRPARTNVADNWKRVRRAIKGLLHSNGNAPWQPSQIRSSESRRPLISKTKNNTGHASSYHLNSTKQNSDTVQNQQPLIVTVNQIPSSGKSLEQGKLEDQQLVYVVTCRSIPDLRELAQQRVGRGQIDTTGVWVWQAEEVMAYYLAVNFEAEFSRFASGHVLEIGAGSSGLAALAFAKLCNPGIKKQPTQQNAQTKSEPQVWITDGNQANINFLAKSIEMNFPAAAWLNSQTIKTMCYKWGGDWPRQTQNEGECWFDLIMAADCLFFEQYHRELLLTLVRLLRPVSGLALFVNPQRGSSLAKFIAQIEHFNVQNGGETGWVFRHELVQFRDPLYQEVANFNRGQKDYNKDCEQMHFLQVAKIGQAQKP